MILPVSPGLWKSEYDFLHKPLINSQSQSVHCDTNFMHWVLYTFTIKQVVTHTQNHDMHPPSKMGGGALKILEKKTVKEREKILILEGGLCYGRVNFSRRAQKVFWGNGKLHNDSIKSNYSNVL